MHYSIYYSTRKHRLNNHVENIYNLNMHYNFYYMN